MKDGAPVLWIVFSIWNSDGEVYVDLVRRRMPHLTSSLLRASTAKDVTQEIQSRCVRAGAKGSYVVFTHPC